MRRCFHLEWKLNLMGNRASVVFVEGRLEFVGFVEGKLSVWWIWECGFCRGNRCLLIFVDFAEGDGCLFCNNFFKVLSGLMLILKSYNNPLHNFYRTFFHNNLYHFLMLSEYSRMIFLNQ